MNNDIHHTDNIHSHPSDTLVSSQRTLDSDLIEALCQLSESLTNAGDDIKDTPEVTPRLTRSSSSTLNRQQVLWKLDSDLRKIGKPKPTRQELLDRETARRKRMQLWRPLKKSEGFMKVKADLEEKWNRKISRDEALTHLLIMYWASLNEPLRSSSSALNRTTNP